MTTNPDPRLSANEFLADRIVRHQLYLTRLQTQEARQLAKLLEEAIPDVVTRIERRLKHIETRGGDLGAGSRKRLSVLLAGLDDMLEELYEQGRVQLRGNMIDIAQQEVEFQHRLLQQATPVRIDLSLPSKSLLTAVATERPFAGLPLRRWFEGLAAAQRTNLEKAIRLGMAESDTVDQIVQRIRGTQALRYRDGALALGYRQAEAVARTAVNHIGTFARESLYQANRDVVKGIQIVATLDTRTTPICRRRDGEVYAVGEGPRPPFHPGCRTTTAPVLKSWRELGIRLAEAPAGTRASMNGQVAARLTYGDWLRRQSRQVQEEALGPSRARVFRNGRMSIKQFTDRRGRAFTLDELRRREADVFAGAV